MTVGANGSMAHHPQVSFDWALESTTVFKAVAYLDHYLSAHAVEQLSR